MKENGILVDGCIFIMPSKSGNEYHVYDGGSYEKFSEKSPNFVKVYYVKSKVKGQGFGEKLFNKLKEYLLSIDINTIYLDVDIDNIRAQKFYHRIGFKDKWKGFDIRMELNF